jgi:acyl-CoA synthetase (NDP forming)
MSASLAPLFHPRGVAFVGATPDPQRYGGRVVQYCVREGYAGSIHTVNPKYPSIFDVPCHRDLASIPRPVDVVVILVGPAQVPRLLDECRERGVRYAIALGDIVAPDAPDRAARLRAIRRQIENGAPRIVGPVCVGLISPHASLALTMSSGMIAGAPPKGGIGLVSQSGGVLSAVLDRAHQFGSGFSALVSSGSEFDLDLCDYVEHLIDDPHTRCIALYAEKILDAPRLFALAQRARLVGKPILLMKAGASEAGARTALTHSGAIAGHRDVEDAAFRRHGIVRVTDVDDLHMSAELLCRARSGPDGGVAAVSQSGGYGTVVADTLTEAGVPIAEIAPRTIERILAETPVLHVGNPHDSATGPPGNNAPHTKSSLIAFQDDPGVGVTLYAETMYMYQDAGHALQKDVTQYGRKPHIVCWQGGRATEPVLASLRRDGVLTFDSLRATASALSALYRYRALRREPALFDEGTTVPISALPSEAGVLADADAKALLRTFGVPLAPEAIASSAADAAKAALRLGFPAAVKGIVTGVAHKTELGLVALNLASAKAVAHACDAMIERASTPPSAFLVQPMVGNGIEFVVGVKADRTMGPAILLGLGGVFVEALGAPAIELAPLDRRIAERMIATIDRKGILGGYRTGKALDHAGLVDTLVAVGRLAWALRDRIEGLDLNPVIVTAKGTYAVDAVVSLHAAPAADANEHTSPQPG